MIDLHALRWTPRTFAKGGCELTTKLCFECDIRIQGHGKGRFLVGVRLKPATEQPEPLRQAT